MSMYNDLSLDFGGILILAKTLHVCHLGERLSYPTRNMAAQKNGYFFR